MLVSTAFSLLGMYNVKITQMADSSIDQVEGGAWCTIEEQGWRQSDGRVVLISVVLTVI